MLYLISLYLLILVFILGDKYNLPDYIVIIGVLLWIFKCVYICKADKKIINYNNFEFI